MQVSRRTSRVYPLWWIDQFSGLRDVVPWHTPTKEVCGSEATGLPRARHVTKASKPTCCRDHYIPGHSIFRRGGGTWGGVPSVRGAIGDVFALRRIHEKNRPCPEKQKIIIRAFRYGHSQITPGVECDFLLQNRQTVLGSDGLCS